MSGIAVIVPNADFSKKNYGAVNILSDLSIKKLSISGDSVLQGEHFTFDIIFSPSFTNQTDVRWSILEGSEYASINPDTGELTINETANQSSVTIKVESLSNPNIYATKMLTVTYEDLEDILNGMEIFGNLNAVGSSIYSINYAPENTSYKGVTWSISDGADCASINQKGELTVSKEGYVKIKATSKVYPDVFTTKIVHVEPKDENLIYSLDQPFVGKGSNYIDTGFVPYQKENQEWTVIICVDCSSSNTSGGFKIYIGSDFNTSPYNGFTIYITGTKALNVKMGETSSEISLINAFKSNIINLMYIGVSKDSTNHYNLIFSQDGVNFEIVEKYTYHEFMQSNLSAYIGARRSSSADNKIDSTNNSGHYVHFVNIYDKYMSDTEIVEKLKKITIIPEIKSLSYELNQTFVGNSIDKYWNTGIHLLDQNMRFSLLSKFKIPGDLIVSDSPGSNVPISIISAFQEKSPYYGLGIGLNKDSKLNVQAANGVAINDFSQKIKDIYVWVMVQKNTDNTYKIYAAFNDDVIQEGEDHTFEDNKFVNLPISIGASYKASHYDSGLWRFSNAEINFLQVYSYILTKEEFQSIINKNS